MSNVKYISQEELEVLREFLEQREEILPFELPLIMFYAQKAYEFSRKGNYVTSNPITIGKDIALNFDENGKITYFLILDDYMGKEWKIYP